jgi:hypothetical protein
MTSDKRSCAAVLCLVLAGLPLAACRPSLRRLDEASMYEGTGLRLKVVRYHENLPLHFTGEIGVVQCASSGTQGLAAGRTNDPGWVALGRVSALGSGSASELLPRARADYLVVDEGTLVWKGTVLQVSYDGCASFAMWDPTTLPAERINPVAKPDYCAPRGTADCRYHDFMDDRTPDYTEIQVRPDGRIGFLARSRSFVPPALRVTSEDSGKTWRITPAE